MADQLDLDNRDPNNLNDHVKIHWEDVFAEPDGTHSHPCLWKCSYTCFNGTKKCCYYTLTFLCGWYLAFYWACEFACLAMYQIWWVIPGLRVFQIQLGALQKYWGTCVSCCCAPIFETCGLCFSRIVVRNEKD